MGTRSLTRVIEDGEHIVCMYRQFDGYLEGMGRYLYDFLKDITLVNGLGFNEKRRVANGAGCLAAQIVAHFKEEPGGIYLYPVTVTYVGQEYEYRLHITNNVLTIEAIDCERQLYIGDLEGFKTFIDAEAIRAKEEE